MYGVAQQVGVDVGGQDTRSPRSHDPMGKLGRAGLQKDTQRSRAERLTGGLNALVSIGTGQVKLHQDDVPFDPVHPVFCQGLCAVYLRHLDVRMRFGNRGRAHRPIPHSQQRVLSILTPFPLRTHVRRAANHWLHDWHNGKVRCTYQ